APRGRGLVTVSRETVTSHPQPPALSTAEGSQGADLARTLSVPAPEVREVIIGVGTDLVGVRRFAATLRRTPALAERLFTPAERVTGRGGPRSARSLAARFAAKEAAAKALGAPPGYRFTDCEVVAEPSRQP